MFIHQLLYRGDEEKQKIYYTSPGRLADAVELLAELRQKSWTQHRVSKELEIPWVTLKRWALKGSCAPLESGGFRAVQVVDSLDSPRSPVLISPSGWRIEGLSAKELVALAGRL